MGRPSTADIYGISEDWSRAVIYGAAPSFNQQAKTVSKRKRVYKQKSLDPASKWPQIPTKQQRSDEEDDDDMWWPQGSTRQAQPAQDAHSLDAIYSDYYCFRQALDDQLGRQHSAHRGNRRRRASL